MVSAGCYASSDVTTPLYEAPELFQQRRYTNKVDVFAFAVVLYEILGGAMDSSFDSIDKVMEGNRASFPDSMTDDMKSLISRCWAQNPDDRQSFSDIMVELKRIEFKILPGVDLGRVRTFLSDVGSKQAMIFSSPWRKRETRQIFKKALEACLLDRQLSDFGFETRIDSHLMSYMTSVKESWNI
jgi:serine/threonine protein kinase